MKQMHRKVHGYLWLLLFPVLLVFVYLAQRSELPPAPGIERAPSPSQLGELP